MSGGGVERLRGSVTKKRIGDWSLPGREDGEGISVNNGARVQETARMARKLGWQEGK